MNGLAWAFSRDLAVAWRHPGEGMLTLAFFVLVASLFPLGIGADPQLLARVGPGVIWVCALLAAFLGLPALFASDYAGWITGQVIAIDGGK